MVKPLEFLRSHYSLQPPAQPSRPRRGPLASDFKRRSALRAQVTSDSSSLVTETPATSPPTIQPALETPSSKQIASKATGKGKTERPFDFGLAPQKPDDSPSLAAPSLHGRRPTPRNVRFGPATKVGGQRKTSYAKILKEEEEWTLEEDSDQDGSDTEVCSDSSGDVEMLFLLPGSELAQNKALARSRHRQDLKQLMAMLERGPLLTSPHHDLIRIVPLLMTAKKRSYRIINRSSRDLTKVVELKIGNYVKQVDKTKSALLNARVRIGGTKSIGRSRFEATVVGITTEEHCSDVEEIERRESWREREGEEGREDEFDDPEDEGDDET
ncbi:uncharacterized protein JCM6883_001134 [Sporobolomyces salmoneus]|uniref:uncharacterized protein n=1 Tax=Sporobolomyces salmoneus TaxID=183962 RepID=UPI0031806417